MVVSERIADWVRDKYFAGGLTYSGHPLACAAGVASIEAFREEGIVENAAAMGEVLAEELPRLAERHPSIGDVRGRGLFWGVELVRNRESREPLLPYNAGAEADGRPQCSYKGGEPGSVRVLDEHTVAFPNYDGNGMYLSAGNVLVNPHVGLLFISFEQRKRMRLNGVAEHSEDDPLLAEYPEAQFLTRV